MKAILLSAERELYARGALPAAAVRGGAELEWLPVRLRVRAGSYREPARFEGVGGRLHVTVGADVRLLELRLFDPPPPAGRRLQHGTQSLGLFLVKSAEEPVEILGESGRVIGRYSNGSHLEDVNSGPLPSMSSSAAS